MYQLTQYLSFAVHGDQGGHGGGAAGVIEQILAFLETLTANSPGEIFALLLPGVAAMDNIHPMLVHFPIAFFTAFVLIDIIGSLFKNENWRQAASWFLYCGTIMAFATVAAGLVAAGSVPHGGDVHNIMERHKNLAISVLSLASFLSLWRLFGRAAIIGGANVLYQILTVLLAGLLILTADLGGLMVYKYGVAVESTSSSMLDHFKAHQHSH